MTKGQKIVLMVGACGLFSILVLCALYRPDMKTDAEAYGKSYEYETQAIIYFLVGVALGLFSFRKPKPKGDNSN
jgi:hypothetical protein